MDLKKDHEVKKENNFEEKKEPEQNKEIEQKQINNPENNIESDIREFNPSTPSPKEPPKEPISIVKNKVYPEIDIRLRENLLQHRELIESLEQVLNRISTEPNDPLAEIEIEQMGKMLAMISNDVLKTMETIDPSSDTHKLCTNLIQRINSDNLVLKALSPHLKERTYGKYLSELM